MNMGGCCFWCCWLGRGSWVRCGRDVRIRPVEGESKRSASASVSGMEG